MNILLTGCAGFIGSNLANELLNSKYNSIIGIDNFDDFYDISIKENNIKNMITSNYIELIF